MFFIMPLERTISLHPSFFGPHTRSILTKKLHEDVEGTVKNNYYIICVIDIQNIPEGRVVPGSGLAEYVIEYRAVVWKPFKGEVLDGLVTSVLSSGIIIQVGPLESFVPHGAIGPGMNFDGNATPPQWTDNGDNVIERGSQVRFRITGIRMEIDQMYALGTLSMDYLGVLSDA